MNEIYLYFSCTQLQLSYKTNCDSLWTLKVSVDNFVLVEVVHARCNFLGPISNPVWWYVLSIFQEVIEWTIGTILHHNAVTGCCCAHTPEKQRGKIRRATRRSLIIVGMHV